MPAKDKAHKTWICIFDMLGWNCEYGEWRINGCKADFITQNMYIRILEDDIWDYNNYKYIHREYILSKCPLKMAIVGANNYLQIGKNIYIGKIFSPNGRIENFVVNCKDFPKIWREANKKSKKIQHIKIEAILIMILYIIFLLAIMLVIL